MNVLAKLSDEKVSDEVRILPATTEHLRYVPAIVQLIEDASNEPGAALAKRSAEYVTSKIEHGFAVIALTEDDKVVGFQCLSPWEGDKFVSHSALVVHPNFRRQGLSREIKGQIVELTRKKFPEAIMFGITLSPSVMSLNTAHGFRPVGYDSLTKDDAFWKGCETCPYHDVLLKMQRTVCLCTALRLDPEPVSLPSKKKQ